MISSDVELQVRRIVDLGELTDAIELAHYMHEATLGVPISDGQEDLSGPIRAFYAVLRSLTRLAA